MTEHQLQDELCDLLQAIGDLPDAEDLEIEAPEALADPAEGISRVCTFREAGVLTRDAGLVIRMRDGREYQFTVVRSQ